MMSLADFKRIIANLRSAFDVSIVSLHRDGEPLLNKHLEDYISHLTRAGTCVTISSNCSLLSEERARALIASGLSLITTDFCADPKTYERLRIRGDWKQTLDGIRKLLSVADETKAKLRLIMKDIATDGMGTAQSQTSMQRTRELFATANGRLTIVPARFHNALGGSRLSNNGSTNPATVAHPFASDAMPGGNHRNGTYSLCHQPWVNLTVDFAGRVVGCCRDLRSEYVAGNLLQESAAEIWNGERMRFLRSSLAAKQPQRINTCKTCDMPWRGSCSGRTAVERSWNFFFADVWEREVAPQADPACDRSISD